MYHLPEKHNLVKYDVYSTNQLITKATWRNKTKKIAVKLVSNFTAD